MISDDTSDNLCAAIMLRLRGPNSFKATRIIQKYTLDHHEVDYVTMTYMLNHIQICLNPFLDGSLKFQ